MTDAPLPPDDELVSAYLDGEVNEVERAHVEASADLLARVEALRSTVATFRAAPLPTSSPELREVTIAAALAAAATGTEPGSIAPADHLTAPGPGPIAPVVDLASRRRRPVLPFLVAAACAVVLLLGLSAVLSTRGRSSNDFNVAGAPVGTALSPTRQADEALASESSKTADAAAGDPPAPEVAPTSTTSPPLTSTSSPTSDPPVTTATNPAVRPNDSALAAAVSGRSLGSLGSPADVRRAVDLATGESDGVNGGVSGGERPTEAATVDQIAAAQRCDAAVRSRDSEVGELAFAAAATYQGTPALVLRYRIAPEVGNANGTIRLHVVAADTCAPLDVQTT